MEEENSLKETKKVKKESTKKSIRKKPQFTKDSTLGEVIQKKPDGVAILLGFGMHCFGCPVTQFETLEEAAMVHGVELDFLLKKLNEN
ncbi:MAG: DUF1858 domain-containing protein [Clostridia bacterium]|nr:DUF1858 domain-containing protein [Clostridia bacterium]